MKLSNVHLSRIMRRIIKIFFDRKENSIKLLIIVVVVTLFTSDLYSKD